MRTPISWFSRVLLGMWISSSSALHADIVIDSGGTTFWNSVLDYENENIRVGWNGTAGNLEIESPADVVLASTSGAWQMSVGRFDGVNDNAGTVTMTGGSLGFEGNDGDLSYLMIGGGSAASSGTFNQSGGAVSMGHPLVIGFDNGTGEYNISGGQLLVDASSGTSLKHIHIGYNQYTGANLSTTTQGRLNVTGTAEVLLQGLARMYVGSGFNQGGPSSSGVEDALQGGSGSIVQNGEDSLVNLDGAGVYFGWGGGGSVQPEGGYGEYKLQAGTLTVGNGSEMQFGASAGNEGKLVQEGGTLTAGARVTIGQSGTGSYDMSGGRATFNGGLTVAAAAGSNGTVNLTGGTIEAGGSNGITRGGGTASFNMGGGTIRVVNSDLTISLDVHLNDASSNTWDSNGFNISLGGNLSGGGTLVKTGQGTLAMAGAANEAGSLVVREGRLEITGGQTDVDYLWVDADGNDSSASELKVSGGTVNIGGVAGNVYPQRVFFVGSGAGKEGLFTFEEGVLNVGSLSTPTVRVDFEVGSFGASGTVNQTGGDLALNSNGGIFHIGNQGEGVYNLSGGSISAKNAFALGRSTVTGGAGNGTLNISGGTLALSANSPLLIGGVDGAGATNEGTGLVEQTGGVVTANGYIELGTRGGTGTYNLYGGTLEAGGGSGGIRRDAANNGTAYFNLGGGTLKVINRDLSSSVNLTVEDRDAGGGATDSYVNTNGFNATFSGNLSGSGDLIKQGAGNLNLSGNNVLTGEVYVEEGGINQTSGNSAVKYLSVGAKSGAAGNYNLSSGSMDISQAFQVGDFGGTGTFTQTGGSINVLASASFNIGNQGGTGVYNLSGGSLSLTGGLYTLGRADGGNPAGNGTLNLSAAGTIDVLGGNFIIGDRSSLSGAVHNGYGTVNQTGGTFRVGNGANLFLAGLAPTVAGAVNRYNLTGGVLEIGGTSLQPHYSGASPYEFNLGGGTIRVIGSSLSTSAKPTFVAATVSTIATGSFNANFLSGFDGAGGFRKTGSGALIFGGSSTLQADSEVEGILAVGNAATAALTIDGADITVKVSGSAVSRIQVGVNGGTGTATLAAGSVAIDDSAATSGWGTLDVGRGSGSRGTFNQTGGSVDISGGALQIGYSGGRGSYTLSNAAVLESGAGSSVFLGSGTNAEGVLAVSGSSRVALQSQVFVGAGTNGVGRITQTGADSEVTFSGPVVAFGTASDEGPLAGTGSYGLEAGELKFLNVNDAGTYGVRFGDGGSGTLNQSGGTLTASNSNVVFGHSGTGAYNLSGGTGTFHNGIRLAQGAGAVGTINLSGGTLELGGVNGISKGSGTALLRFDGGTLKVIGSNLTTSVNAELAAGKVSTLDTNNLNAAFSGNISGGGTLVKTGAGTASLQGSVVAERITVQQGLLSGTGSVSGDVVVAGGAGLTGSLNVGGHTVVQAGAVHRPGFSPEANYSSGSYDLESGALLVLEIGGVNGGAGSYADPVTGGFDQLLFGGDINFELGSVLEVNGLEGFIAEFGDSFNLLYAGGEIFGLQDLSLIGTGTLAGYQFQLSLVQDEDWNGSGGHQAVQLTVVPEPGTVLLLAAGLGWIFFFRRRWKKAFCGN